MRALHPKIKQMAAATAAVVAGAVVTIVAAVPALAQDSTGTIVPLDHPFAPFLESRAFAASKGATAEFRKMEWIAVDPVNNKLYMAMSEVGKGMSDGEGAIQVEENLCGIVYVGDIDADYNVSKLSPLIVGGPYDETAEENQCDVNNIANPDNLSVDSAGRLWIGEDTSLHANNVLWMYDGTLHRFGTVPNGAETTGVHIAKDGTLFFNAQHPSGSNPHPYNRGLIGVVNGFKATDSFTDLAVPEGADRDRVMVAAGEYQILGRAGEAIPGEVFGARFGQLDDVTGNVLDFCNHPDGNMFLPVDEAGSEGSLYTNFECIPGGVSRIYIRNNGTTWDVVEGENVNFAAVNGTWTNCGSSVTPWNTAITSEEYEPIATLDAWKDNIAGMSEYMGGQANPYDYGYLVEMMPDGEGDGLGSLVQKRYAMGRFSHENGVVMADNKTVYHGDDGTDVVFFKSVADEAGDLSAGTLYAAKVTQTEDGSFDLEWIELGKGNDDEIAEAIAMLELPE
jgi:secreted PhoX family phosphatase